MGNSGRAALIFLALSGLSGCRWESGGPIIDRQDLEVELGTGGLIDLSRWNMLRLRIKNRGEDFRGTVEVEGVSLGTDAEPVTYRLEIEVPGQGTTTREIAFAVRPEGWQGVQVTFRQRGFSRRLAFMTPADATSRFQILEIGNDRTDFSALIAEVAESLPAETSPIEARKQVFHRKPAELPAQSLAYDPFQMVVLWGSSLADSPPGAIEALSDWVARGGTLVAFPGEGWAAGLPPPVLGLLGVTLGDPRAEMAPLLRVEIGAAASSGFHRQLAPAAGSRTLGGGLAFASSHGAGRVLTFSFRPAGAFPEPLRAPGIYSALRPALARSISFAGDFEAAMRQIERLVTTQLSEMSGFHVPARSSVALGLGIYLAAGFLLPYLVIRATRRKRREWTYPAVVLAAAATTFAIYRFGLLSGMDSAELEEVTLLRLHADGKTAEAISFLGFISPRMEWIDLPAEDQGGADGSSSHVLPQPLRGELSQMLFGGQQMGIPPLTIEIDSGRYRLPPFRLHPNAHRFLRFDHRIGVPDSMRGTGRSLEASVSDSNHDPIERSIAEVVRRALDGEPQEENSLMLMRGPQGPFIYQRGSRSQGGKEARNIREPLALLTPTIAVSILETPIFPGGGVPARRRAITVMFEEQDPWEGK